MEVAQELGLRLELLKPIVERALLREDLAGQSITQALVKVAPGSIAEWWPETFNDIVKQHQVVTKVGARVLRTPRSWWEE
jgi:hypothetical protein